MERVRKGRGLLPEEEKLMKKHKVPEWYIESCKKIKYMFPKAHAVAYTMSSLRVAWFKVNYPEAYYCAFFTVRADEFDATTMCSSFGEVCSARRTMQGKGRLDPRGQKVYYILELVEEMMQRKIKFLPITLEDSLASDFYSPAKGEIRPPLSAIPGVSKAQAELIVKAREESPLKTREDLTARANVGPALMEVLAANGCLGDMPESSQMNLFELMGW